MLKNKHNSYFFIAVGQMVVNAACVCPSVFANVHVHNLGDCLIYLQMLTSVPRCLLTA